MSAEPIEIKIPQLYAGKRLDSALPELLLSLERYRNEVEPEQLPSRSRLQQWIRDGNILLDGQQSRPAQKIRGGELLTVMLPEPKPLGLEPEAIPLDVLYEDRDLIVVNKPPGMVVHPGAGHSSGTLVHGLLHHCQDLSGIGDVLRPGIVHRLDRGTSGAMVVAKTDRAHEGLTKQFAEREVHKRYLAVVYGSLEPARGIIETLYGRHPTDRKKYSSKVARGKKAVTSYGVVASNHGLSQVDVLLGTGRTHQIRVHLSDRGNPIVGDPMYGGRQYSRVKGEQLKELVLKLEYQALHARELGFTHPATGENLKFTAELPEVLDALVEKLVEPGDT